MIGGVMPSMLGKRAYAPVPVSARRAGTAVHSGGVKLEGGIVIETTDVQRSREFHGHMCPGLAIGIRAADLALDRIGSRAADEEMVAVVETDMCAVDAVQVLTGCTFGKGNLVHRDYGKNAFTFISRPSNQAIRIVTKPQGFVPRSDEHSDLFSRIRTGTADEADQNRFWELQEERAKRVLEAPIDDIFVIDEVDPVVPARARIHDSVICAGCGEQAMETRAHLFRGQIFCTPCFEERDRS